MGTQNITRRGFVKAAGMGVAALAAGKLASRAWAGPAPSPNPSPAPSPNPSPAPGSGPAAAKHPNVLFMAVDDLNNWVGCLGGHPDTKTPNMDRLAARGVLFTSAHCAAPACNPSRAALLTGYRPSTSGVYLNSQPWRGSPLLKDAVTLPQHFMRHGYSVIGSGKIFHDEFPDPPSWQEYWPSKTETRPEDPTPPKEKQPLNGFPNRGNFDWGSVDAPKEKMGDWQVADWVIGQLAKKHDKPFFLGCGFYRPHLPWYVPPEYFAKFPEDKVTLPTVKEDDLDDVPPIGKQMANPGHDHANVIKYHQWRHAVQSYLASINFADECVGRVLDAFDKCPDRDNTIVVLWSDHGWHLGEKLHWRKFTLWEEATHNVLMFVVPGVTQPGGRCASTVSLLDIYPTMIDLCGLAPRKELEGVSLVPLLKDPKAKWDRPALTTHGKNNHSIRSDRWRYIRYSDETEELYDRDKDPKEWTNLAGDPKYADVKKDLAKWLPTVNAPDAPGGSGFMSGHEEDDPIVRHPGEIASSR